MGRTSSKAWLDKINVVKATWNAFCSSYTNNHHNKLVVHFMKQQFLPIKFIVAALIFLTSLPVGAQILTRELEFVSERYDFGEVASGSKKIETSFVFTNTGENDFTISNIRAACHCTSVEYTKGVIKPGQRGSITAIYDPTGHSGDIDKEIYIEGNFKNAVFKTVRITGRILHPMANQAPEKYLQYYAGQLGYLRILEPHVSFGLMNHRENRLRTFHIVNDGQKPYEFVKLISKPDFLEYSIDKKKIEPGDTAEVRMVMIGRKVPDLGYFGEHFQFLTTDAFYKQKDLGISVEMVQDFSHLTKKELRKSPKIELDRTKVELGTMKEGSTKSAVFTITNKGKTPLEIKKIKTHCSCTVVSGHDTIIPKKGSTKLTITFDSVFKSGSQTKTVTLYTNDPKKPQTELVLHATVVEP